MNALLPLALLFVSGQTQAPEQEATLRRLVQENRYSIRLEDGLLVGPGGDFLRRETRNVQFVGLGERHFNRDIPAITTALFRDLQRLHGFEYLAVENSPLAMRTFSQRPHRGSLDQMLSYVRKYPYAIAFNNDQEIEMLAEISRLSKARSRPIWGLDQEFGALHALDFLHSRATRESQRRAVERLRPRVAEVEEGPRSQESHWMSRHARAVDFERLRTEYAPAEGSEEEFVIRQLALSQEIYSYFPGTGPSGEPVGRLNNYVREENMKALFVDEYRRAQQRGDATPKVILKFGQWHLYRGLSPGGIYPLGNFASEFAKYNRMESLNIFFAIQSGEELPDEPNWNALRPFIDATKVDEWALYDLRPLRNYWFAGLLPINTAPFSRLVNGFDLVFVLGGSQPATTDRVSPPPRR
jgi:hypothetical protein